MRRLTIERVTLIVVFALLFAIAVRVPVDTDTWWHIRSGEHVLTTGMIYGDPFSHTMDGQSWINHSWGSQIVMYGVWQFAGNAGLALFTAVLAVGGMAVLYHVSGGNTYLRAFLLVLGASTAAVFWSARPQMFSFFFSTVILWIVFSYKRRKVDRLWWLVPVFWLWGNLHAGWSIGYLFLAAFIVGEALNNLFKLDQSGIGWAGWRKLVLVTVASVPVLLVSPYGLDNLLVPLNTVSIGPLRDFIQEWNSPAFQGRETWPFIATIMIAFFVLWTSHLQFDWSGYFLLIGTMFLALLYGRNIAVFAVVAVPVLSYHGDYALARRGWVLQSRSFVRGSLAYLNLALLIAVVAGVLIYCAGVLLPTTIEPLQEEYLPVRAAAYMREHELPREMFNSYNWGGYLMFAAPEYPVFIDGRTDLYGDFLLTYRDAVLVLDNWREIFADYDIQLVVIEAASPLALALENEVGWVLNYQDEQAVIYSKGAE